MEKTPNTFSNVTHLDLPEAKYTILYGMHVVQQNPKELPKDADYLLLETGMHEYLKDEEYTVKRLSNHVQYRGLFEEADKKNIPIVFADLKYKYNDFLLLFLDNAASAAGWFAGTKLLKKSFEHGKKRNIRSASVMAVLAGWLILPFALNALRLGSTIVKKGEKETNQLKRLAHRLHPEAELLYLTLRNAVIAEKAKNLARQSSKKPHIAIVLGAGHVGIEDMLTMPDSKRLSLLTRWRKVLRYLANPEYLFTTLVSKKERDNWQFTRSVTPSLKTLLA